MKIWGKERRRKRIITRRMREKEEKMKDKQKEGDSRIVDQKVKKSRR